MTPVERDHIVAPSPSSWPSATSSRSASASCWRWPTSTPSCARGRRGLGLPAPEPTVPLVDLPASARPCPRWAAPWPADGRTVGIVVDDTTDADDVAALVVAIHGAYAPGDDLRHVDWAAYARSELLAVRLYREEVAPRIDLVLDISRSMVVTEQKLRAYGELAGLLACACASTAADSRIITTSAVPPQPLHVPEDIERFLACDASLSALEETHLPFRRRSLRVVVSDFLFPHDAEALVSRLARDSALLALVQLTLREEAEPVVEGGRRLVDVEGRGELDLVIDEAAIRDYRARFARLRLGLVGSGPARRRRLRARRRGHAGSRGGAWTGRGGSVGGRMIFAAPLGLLALLAIPAIVAIHLFRRRFPVRPVAGLFLWQIGRQTPEGGGKIARLPITASLILECLAALALALILAGARISSADVSPHLVVLLDDSASMAAVNGRGESTRDRAVRRVLEELDRLGSRARRDLRPERRTSFSAAGSGAPARRSAARTGQLETGSAASFAGTRTAAGA